MKAKRRHDLKENELAKDLDKAKVFFELHWKWLVGGLVAVVAIIGLIFLIVDRTKTNRQEEWQRFHALVMAAQVEPSEKIREDLRGLAAQTGQDDLAAWAYLQAGKTAYAELMYKYVQLDPQAREKLAAETTQAYEKVISSYSSNVAATGAAHLGLGLLAETQGQMDKAKDQYNKAIVLGARGARVSADQATVRLKGLRELSSPIALAPGEPPAPAGAAETAPSAGSQPTTSSQPAAAPATQPG